MYHIPRLASWFSCEVWRDWDIFHTAFHATTIASSHSFLLSIPIHVCMECSQLPTGENELSYTYTIHLHLYISAITCQGTKSKSGGSLPSFFLSSPSPSPSSDRRRHSSARLSQPLGGSSPVTIQKANSCSTIYTDDSTVSLPNLKYTLKWCGSVHMIPSLLLTICL